MLLHSLPPALNIGEYYTDAMPGLAFYTSAKDSILLRVFWFDEKKKGYAAYKDFIASSPSFGPSDPNDSYHRLEWTVDNKRVTFEWSRTGAGAAVRMRSTGKIKLIAWLTKAWPGSSPEISLNKGGYGLSLGNLKLNLTTNGALRKPVSLESGIGKPTSELDWGETVHLAPVFFTVTPGKPGLIIAQPKRDKLALDRVGPMIDEAAKAYQASRSKATGEWGDFVSPIQNELGHSRVFSCDTGRLSEIVSRGWCLPDGQVLFCWDSFFNGLLASIENPYAGRQTVRAILAAQQPSGLVPNYFGRGWGVSADRSQPPVGSLCVWKMYERDPDKAFLREVFPKLLKWHRWWFTARDGNKDGLLEWGSQTGVLQNAKFESGLDDSPMFDTASMSGTHMTLDSVDLNALWAMDADYLSKIAGAIGEKKEAQKLKSQAAEMGRRINASLWNDSVGTYCYRYWKPREARHPVALASLVQTSEGPGFHGEYYSGRHFENLVTSRQDPDLNFSWTGSSPIEGIGLKDYSVRWTANLTPKQSGRYLFKSYADDGIRVWLDDRLVIDDWKIHGTNETDAPAIQLEAGQSYRLKVEYFQAEGDSTCRLEVNQIDEGAPAEVFYNRLSPLNFYPMMSGVPNVAQGQRMLSLLYNPNKFDGDYMCPTISRDDPAFPAQGYWRGTIWGPTNYLLYQGLRQYASVAQRNEYARKSVALFMKNWNADGTCHENFNAMTGEGRSDPHYTWGALLCLIGIEDLCDIEPDGKLRLNGGSGATIFIHNFRLGGRLYDLDVKPNQALLRENGRVMYKAVGGAKEFRWH